MNIAIRKIAPALEAELPDYTSLNAWEADAGYREKLLAVGVVYFRSNSAYERELQNLGIPLEDIQFNYLLIHSSGKVLAYTGLFNAKGLDKPELYRG